MFNLISTVPSLAQCSNISGPEAENEENRAWDMS